MTVASFLYQLKIFKLIFASEFFEKISEFIFRSPVPNFAFHPPRIKTLPKLRLYLYLSQLSNLGQIWTAQRLLRTFKMRILEHFRQLQFKRKANFQEFRISSAISHLSCQSTTTLSVQPKLDIKIQH